MSAVGAPIPTTTLRVCLPNDLVEQYEAVALTTGETLDEVCARGLRSALDFVGRMSYMIDAAGDKEIRRMLGGKIDSQAKLLDMIGRLLSVHVGGIKVELRTSLQEQIHWALRSMGKEGDKQAAAELIGQAIAEKFRA